ncbi:MAG: DUF357 domain-containing protein [Methanoregula sp.]|nr:MAG: DUF357 domain-containing protein [Methanoregula sp.]
MRVAECRDFLSNHLGFARITAPEKTPLYATAEDILGMAAAYLHDGTTFLSSGDWVNALASFCYGYGWLHFGAITGYVEMPSLSCPFSTPFEHAPAALRGRLEEKCARYARMLDTARLAVVPSPEQGTVMHAAADRVLAITAVYGRQGGRFEADGHTEDALACFSYGHGWLDAAVRAGIFTIVSDRDLFTV